MTATSTSSNILSIAPSTSNTPTPPSNNQTDDKQTFFADAMHQHGADTSASTPSKPQEKSNTDKTADTSTQATTSTAATPDRHTDPTDTKAVAQPDVTKQPDAAAEIPAATTAPKGKLKPTAITAPTDLASMIVQATLQASNNVKAAPVATTAKPATTDADPTPAKDTAKPGDLDLATLIAQAAIATSNAASNATSAASSASTAATTTAAATTPATAQVAKTAEAVGSELPSAVPVKAPTTASTKEKKSTLATTEGIFLQSGTAASQSVASQLAAMMSPSKDNANVTVNKQVATNDSTKNSALNALSAAPSNTAGTANVEKDTAMNATLNMTEIAAGNGMATTPQHTDSDVHVQLSSNNDFNSALKQVLHAATVSDSSSLRTPMRISMELHTPPGAIVNVYLSKQADGYRAQLSTNDPAALSWVQNKLSDLRQTNDLGVNVKWLPAQSESGTTSVSSSSNSSNDGLGWDRGGQNQQGQQQDERQQQRQKKDDLFPGMPSLANNSFMKNLTALGRAA